MKPLAKDLSPAKGVVWFLRDSQVFFRKSLSGSANDGPGKELAFVFRGFVLFALNLGVLFG